MSQWSTSHCPRLTESSWPLARQEVTTMTQQVWSLALLMMRLCAFLLSCVTPAVLPLHTVTVLWSEGIEGAFLPPPRQGCMVCVTHCSIFETQCEPRADENTCDKVIHEPFVTYPGLEELRARGHVARSTSHLAPLFTSSHPSLTFCPCPSNCKVRTLSSQERKPGYIGLTATQLPPATHPLPTTTTSPLPTAIWLLPISMPPRTGMLAQIRADERAIQERIAQRQLRCITVRAILLLLPHVNS